MINDSCWQMRVIIFFHDTHIKKFQTRYIYTSTYAHTLKSEFNYLFIYYEKWKQYLKSNSNVIFTHTTQVFTHARVEQRSVRIVEQKFFPDLLEIFSFSIDPWPEKRNGVVIYSVSGIGVPTYTVPTNGSHLARVALLFSSSTRKNVGRSAHCNVLETISNKTHSFRFQRGTSRASRTTHTGTPVVCTYVRMRFIVCRAIEKSQPLCDITTVDYWLRANYKHYHRRAIVDLNNQKTFTDDAVLGIYAATRTHTSHGCTNQSRLFSYQPIRRYAIIRFDDWTGSYYQRIKIYWIFCC